MKELLSIRLTSNFILERAVPTAGEIGFAYERGWLPSAELIRLVTAKRRIGYPMTRTEEKISMLLSDDNEELHELAADLSLTDEPQEVRQQVWTFLVLEWLWVHRGEFRDPYEIIELLYADLDYPDEMAQLVRFMPVAEHNSEVALNQRWRQYLESRAEFFRERGKRMLSTEGSA
jgi:hypothetical protein